ncbi:hypothetical protein BH11PLA2_BH11PLA2_20860 [soil metagenome]
MNTLAELSEAWASAMWRASWQGGCAAAAVWAICWLAPSTPARFQSWLWRFVVLKFAIVLLWAAPVAVPLLPAVDVPTLAHVAQASPDRPVMPSEPAIAHEASSVPSPWLIALIVYAVVVAWYGVRILVSFRDAARLRQTCRPSENTELNAQLQVVAKKFGSRMPPRLLEANSDGSPMLIGFVRPAIVFPTITLNRLGVAERETVLSHELAHAQRLDLFWILAAFVVRAVFFFHPLVWLLERRLRLAQEIAADELAVARQNHDPVGYATRLVSVIGKIGSARVLPAMSVGAAGSQQVLKWRLSAMRTMKPLSLRGTIGYGVALGVIAVFGVVPWAVVPAGAFAADKAEPKKEAIDQKDKSGAGRFLSFKDGALTIENNAGVLLVWNNIVENAKTVKYDADAKDYKPVSKSIEALNQVKTGTYMMIGNARSYIRIGARKEEVMGTFASFKNEKLLTIGKNLPDSFTKRYGTNLQYNRFRDDVPVHESVDGGEYKLIGTANKVLGNVKEGTIVIVHGEGDDNITLIQIGLPKSK